MFTAQFNTTAVAVTWMVLETEASDLLQPSVAVHVSVTSPHPLGMVENVDELDVPLMEQPPDNPLLKLSVLDAGTPVLQFTEISPGAVIVGNAAGLT